MAYKSISQMTKEEKLEMGARMVERKKNLSECLRFLRNVESQEISELNVYEPMVNAQPDWVNVCVGQGLPLPDSDAYTKEMRQAGMERHKKTIFYIRQLINEQISELEKAIQEL
jgi:hypothetical protein